MFLKFDICLFIGFLSLSHDVASLYLILAMINNLNCPNSGN
jgi:hypothetical protein